MSFGLYTVGFAIVIAGLIGAILLVPDSKNPAVALASCVCVCSGTCPETVISLALPETG